jgi:hypothetical protein
MSWDTGAADIDAALTSGELQKVSGAQAAGAAWIADARTKLATARTIATGDPATAYVTAYDAARFALVGLLAQQGLRATQRGGHLAVEHAARAQFDTQFADFATLRRRRAELEYPRYPGEVVASSEAGDAIEIADQIVADAGVLLPHLTLF